MRRVISKLSIILSSIFILYFGLFMFLSTKGNFIISSSRILIILRIFIVACQFVLLFISHNYTAYIVSFFALIPILIVFPFDLAWKSIPLILYSVLYLCYDKKSIKIVGVVLCFIIAIAGWQIHGFKDFADNPNPRLNNLYENEYISMDDKYEIKVSVYCFDGDYNYYYSLSARSSNKYVFGPITYEKKYHTFSSDSCNTLPNITVNWTDENVAEISTDKTTIKYYAVDGRVEES